MNQFNSTLATLSFSAAVALASNSAAAQHADHAFHADHSAAQGQDAAATNAAAQRQAAIDSTEAFISAHKQWAQARGASNKAVALQNLIAKAEARYDMMAVLIKTNPAEALRVAIPEEKQVGMPAEVLDLLEQKFEVEGEVEINYQDDFEHPSQNRLHHVLKTPFGERYQLHFAGQTPQLKSGAHVNIEGVLLDDDNGEFNLIVGDEDNSILMLAADGGTTGGSTGGTAAALPNTIGEQRTLVILANLQDNQVQPWSKTQVQDMVFGNVNDFIHENSSQQTWLSGDVLGWFTLPIDSSSCNHNTISAAFRDAAQANGIDLTAYQRHVFVMPKHSSCTFGGIGSVGGSPSTALINGRLNSYTITHELGHNLGLYHANALECGSDALSSSCSHIEYGDTVDTMGGAESHFSAYNKEQLGWLDVTEVTNSGTYTLAPYAAAAASSQPKALKILKSIDPIWGTRNWYYLSYRYATGIDSILIGYDNIQQGVIIQTGDGKRSSKASYLLDMTPNSASANVDWWDPALTAGNSFSDLDAGMIFTTDWVDSNGAQINVELDQPSCTQSQPNLSLTPGQSPWVAAGTTVTYNVTLTNNDGSACAERSFTLNSSQPNGWSADFGQTSASLTPGASISTTLTVTSSSSAVDGFYNIGVTGSSGSSTVSGTVSYVVSNPTGSTNSAPIAVNDDVTITSVGTVSIPVMNNDWDPDNDALTITVTTQGAKGSVKISSSDTLTYTPARNFKNSDSFTYTISDGSKADTATVTVQLQKSSGGDTTGTGKGNGNGKKK